MDILGGVCSLGQGEGFNTVLTEKPMEVFLGYRFLCTCSRFNSANVKIVYLHARTPEVAFVTRVYLGSYFLVFDL